MSLGTGTISATGSANAITCQINALQFENYANIIYQGTYTSPTVRVEVIDPATGIWVGVSCVDLSNNGYNYAAGTDIPLTTNTPKYLKVQGVQGCGQIRTYATGGTGLAIQVGITTYAGQTQQNVVVQLNQTGMLAPVTITGGSATAFVVGPNLTTNPALTVDDSASSCATGVLIQGNAAAAGVFITATSSGGNEAAHYNAKGSGQFVVGDVSTGYTVMNRGALAALIVGNTATAIATQSATVTAAQLLGGVVDHTTVTGAAVVTIDTAANIDTQIATAANGDTFECWYNNIGTQSATITTNTGLTLKGTVAVPSGKNALLKFRRTGAGAWTVYCVVSA